MKMVRRDRVAVWRSAKGCRLGAPENMLLPIGFQNPDGAGFEPAVPFGTHAFQACPIDRSGTHPAEVRLWIQMDAGANEIADTISADSLGAKHRTPNVKRFDHSFSV